MRVNNFRVIFVNAIKKKKDEKAFFPLKQLLSLFHPIVETTPSPQKNKKKKIWFPHCHAVV